MALVRVYCGVAAADVASWLTVAVVDDAGRLLELREFSDDPTGYANLGALLANRSSGPVPVALDNPGYLVTQLLAASDRPLAIPDDTTVADFAERFRDTDSYDESRMNPTQRRALGLARALQAGVLSAMAQSPSWNLEEFKPVLAAHAAIAAGRQSAASALREILRELYPAALRAYPDPAEAIPLKVLEALPEPGLLTSSPSSRTRDAALIAELASTGVADTSTAVAAITALRAAVTESPRWHTSRLLAPVVAETVRQAVAAVRACDAASAALIASLVERLGAPATAPSPYLASSPTAPVSPAPRRATGPAAEVPPSRLAPRASAASAAATGVGPSGGVPGLEPVSVPSMGPVGMPPMAPAAQMGGGAHMGGGPQMGGGAHARVPGGGNGRDADGFTPVRHAPTIPAPRPATPDWSSQPSPQPSSWSGEPAAWPAPPADRSGWSEAPRRDEPMTWADPPPASSYYSEVDPATATTLSFSMDPLNAPLPPPPPPADRPWTANGLPVEPPSLHRVDPPQPPDPLTDPLNGNGTHFLPDSRPDGDLLIFSQTPKSAWFSLPDIDLRDETPQWNGINDDGWRAAEQLVRPAVGADTRAGLPRRVPQANLVPGSAAEPEPHVRIVRDAESIAAHTSGYFRGWRRGQEIGGYAVGQRDRAAWEFNRDQRVRDGLEQPARLSR